MFYLVYFKGFYGMSWKKFEIVNYVEKRYLFEKLKFTRFWWGVIDGLRDWGLDLSFVSYGRG